jgi:hypothetical protein
LIAPPFIELNSRHDNDRVAAEFVGAKGDMVDEIIRLEAKKARVFVRIVIPFLKTKGDEKDVYPVREGKNS